MSYYKTCFYIFWNKFSLSCEFLTKPPFQFLYGQLEVQQPALVHKTISVALTFYSFANIQAHHASANIAIELRATATPAPSAVARVPHGSFLHAKPPIAAQRRAVGGVGAAPPSGASAEARTGR